MATQGFTFNFDVEEDEITKGVESSGATEGIRDVSAAQLHSLQDMLATLPSRISYDTIKIPSHHAIDEILLIRRRELFDIRAQLMSEDVSTDEEEPVGLSAHDIKPDIYEGGFKTWECSIDLAQYLARTRKSLQEQASERHLVTIELGAGSAIPSLLIYTMMLKNELQCRSAQFILADFNTAVLQICTLPNLLLNWASCNGYLDSDQGELELTEQLLAGFLESNGSITFNFISGSWGSSFLDQVKEALRQTFQPTTTKYGPNNSGTGYLASHSDLMPQPCHMLMLASESIYSLSSMVPFANLLADLCTLAEERGNCTSLVAAKRIYFGVGGGVDSFVSCLHGTGRSASFLWEEDQGVGRVILGIT